MKAKKRLEVLRSCRCQFHKNCSEKGGTKEFTSLIGITKFLFISYILQTMKL